MSAYLFLLLVLLCPLMMIFMMRGMHGGHSDGGHGHGAGDCHDGNHDTSTKTSLDDLRRQREELDYEIEKREAEEQAPVGGGWR